LVHTRVGEVEAHDDAAQTEADQLAPPYRTPIHREDPGTG
jgi:hypothetical protein